MSKKFPKVKFVYLQSDLVKQRAQILQFEIYTL